MHSTIKSEPRYLVIQYRLKDSFAPTYLTVLSVIQGVALADLASVVAAGHREFNVLHWLLVVISFGLLIAVWNLYTIHSMIWDWIPDIRDAIIPFFLGAIELTLNHMITQSLDAWLFVGALLGIMASLAVWHARWRASKEEENAELLDLLGRSHRSVLFYVLGASVFVLMLAVASHVGNFEENDGVQGWRGVFMLSLVLLAAGCLCGAVFFSIRYWNRVVEYARLGSIPAMLKTKADNQNRL